MSVPEFYPWQLPQWQQIRHSWKMGHLAHSYLLEGVAGIGKQYFAKVLAGRLLCESDPVGAVCGRCASCGLLAAGTHPDLVWVEPEESLRSIKIERIRQLNDFVHATAQQGGRRVIVIAPAEAMNINAANALLKCLEEPGSDTFFLLVSTRMGAMLPTVRSRCQRIHFQQPDREQAKQWLVEQLGDGAPVNQLLACCSGAPLAAADLFRQGAVEQLELWFGSLKDLLRGRISPVGFSLAMQSVDLALWLGWYELWLNDVIRIACGLDEVGLVHRDQIKPLRYVAGKVSRQSLFVERDWLLQQRDSVLKGQPLNSTLLTESVASRLLERITR